MVMALLWVRVVLVEEEVVAEDTYLFEGAFITSDGGKEE